MKKLLAIAAVLGLALAGVDAGCGKKVTNTGKYEYDAEKKVLTGGDLKKPIAILATTKVTGADGKEAKLEDILSGKVTITSEHNKADSVAVAKKGKKKKDA